MNTDGNISSGEVDVVAHGSVKLQLRHTSTMVPTRSPTLSQWLKVAEAALKANPGEDKCFVLSRARLEFELLQW